MHLHGPTLDDGLQNVPLQLLYGEDDPERPERDADPPVGERHEDGDGTGDEGAEVRDVGADEHERAEAEGAGDAEDEQPHGDAEGVDEGDDRGPPHEPLDGLEGAAGHGLDGGPGATGCEGVGETDSPIGVLEKKKVSSSDSTPVAMREPTMLRPVSSPEAAVAPNFPRSFLALSARLETPSPPATPK